MGYDPHTAEGAQKFGSINYQTRPRERYTVLSPYSR